MKIKVSKNDLHNALSNVTRAISKNSTIPALEGVLLEAKDNSLKLTGFNLEIAIIQQIPAVIKEEGKIILSASLLTNIAKKAAGEDIEISSTEKFVASIKSGKNKSKIAGMNADNYPSLPLLDDVKSITLDAEDFTSAIKTVIYAASTEPSKPLYNGVLLSFDDKHLTAVALDGFRIAVKVIDIEEDFKEDVVVPTKSLLEVLKYKDLEKIKLVVSKRHIAFKLDDEVTLISRILEGNFIDYHKTIPKDIVTSIHVKKEVMEDAIGRIGIFSESAGKINTPVCMDIKADEGIKLSASSSVGNAEEEITPLECVIDGADLTVGVNNRFFADGLKNCQSENVIISLSGPLSPMLIKGEEKDSKELHIVVPMRLAATNK